MIRILRGLALLGPALFPGIASAQQAQNPVNLFVAELKHDGGTLRIGTPRNLTGDRGRNSQPSFTPDGRAIVFSAVRDTTGQGDVYRIDLESGAETRVTRTAENENSPTVIDNGELAAVRWVPATLFREWGLWIYSSAGVPLRGVLPGPDTVGYYTRVDARIWALMRPKSRPAVAIFDAVRGTTQDIDGPAANLPPQVIPGARPSATPGSTRPERTSSAASTSKGPRPQSLGPTVLGRRVHSWLPDGTHPDGEGKHGLPATGDGQTWNGAQ